MQATNVIARNALADLTNELESLKPSASYARLLDGSHTMATICSDLGVPPTVAEQRLLAEWPDCIWVSR